MRWLLGLVLGAGVAAGLLASGSAESTPNFVWPWAGEDGWRYTQGPHLDHALDFQPQIEPNCDDPVDLTNTIRPAAGGTVVDIGVRGEPEPPLPVSILLDHGDGWMSYYTHLANVPSKIEVGVTVGVTTGLGNPSCYGTCVSESGFCANGRHIHFQILRDGSGEGILETTLCGWTVDADGGISRDGVTYEPDLSGPAPIANVDCPTGKGAATPDPTPDATPAPAGAAGDVDCDGESTAVDAALVLQSSAGLTLLACEHNGDVTGDGFANPVDAQIILQYLAGFVERLGPTPEP